MFSRWPACWWRTCRRNNFLRLLYGVGSATTNIYCYYISVGSASVCLFMRDCFDLVGQHARDALGELAVATTVESIITKDLHRA